MKFMKTMLIVGAGIGAGLLVANYMTDGAVFEAASDIVAGVKDRIANKTQDVAEAVTETAENVVDMTSEVI